MEYVRGESLLERIRREPLEYPAVIDLGVQVAEALAAAHALGLIHRDIKAANILLNEAGQAKVADFGLAKALLGAGDGGDAGVTVANLTQTGLVMGTPAYMSPEQARGEPLDARTDVFSLGGRPLRGGDRKPPYPGRVPSRSCTRSPRPTRSPRARSLRASRRSSTPSSRAPWQRVPPSGIPRRASSRTR